MNQTLAYKVAPESGKQLLRQLESNYIYTSYMVEVYIYTSYMVEDPVAQLNNQLDKVGTSRTAETACWQYPELIKASGRPPAFYFLSLLLTVLQEAGK